VADAITQMLIGHIIPHAIWHDSQNYRYGDGSAHAILYCPEIDGVLKDHMYLLKELFNQFAGSLETQQKIDAKRMSLAEFVYLCEQANIIDEALASREVKLALLRSKETDIFEGTGGGDEWRKMNFCEFLEACVRIADAKDLTPLFIKVKSEYDNASCAFDVSSYDFIGVHTSDASAWKATNGNLLYKLPVSKNSTTAPPICLISYNYRSF